MNVTPADKVASDTKYWNWKKLKEVVFMEGHNQETVFFVNVCKNVDISSSLSAA